MRAFLLRIYAAKKSRKRALIAGSAMMVGAASVLRKRQRLHRPRGSRGRGQVAALAAHGDIL
jgi:hypothetical protein